MPVKKQRRFNVQLIETYWCVLDRKIHKAKVVMTTNNKAVVAVCKRKTSALSIAKEYNEQAKTE